MSYSSKWREVMMQKQQHQQRCGSSGGITDDNMNTVLQAGPTYTDPRANYPNMQCYQPQQQQQHYGGYRNPYHQQMQQQQPHHHMQQQQQQQQQQNVGGGYHGQPPYHQMQQHMQQQQQPQQQLNHKMMQPQMSQPPHPYPQHQQQHQQQPSQQMRWDKHSMQQQQQGQPPPQPATSLPGPLMQYRDNSMGGYGARGSPYPPVPSNEPPDTDPNDDPGLPGYSHDRIQNDLLDEICSDIGIKDAMDLDFLDFDTGPGGEAPYMFPGTGGQGGQGGSSDFDLGDMTSTESFINHSSATDNEKLAVAGMTRVLDSPPPIPSIGAPSSVKSDNEKVDSPTVSSSSSEDAPKYNKSAAGSACPPAPHGSPHVHSTTTIEAPAAASSSVDASEPLLRTADLDTGHASSASSSSSSCPSAAVPPQRSTSVDSNCSLPPASPRHQRLAAAVSTDSLKPSTTTTSTPAATLSKTSGFTATLKQEMYTSFSQPASPAKSLYPGNMAAIKHSYSHDNLPHAARSLTGHAAFQMPPPHQQASQQHQHQQQQQQDDGFKVPQGPAGRLMKENLPPAARSSGSPCDGGYYSINSPSLTSSTSVAASSDNSGAPVAELKLSSLPSTADLSIPPIQQDGCSSGASSQPDSPSAMHVAKRARTINNGSDLLEEMRERYSYVKGASIYDPPSRPPSQMHSPTSHQPQQFPFPSDSQHSYQGNPPAGHNATYGYNSSNRQQQQATGPPGMGMYGQQQQQPANQGGWYNNSNPSSHINRSQYMDGSGAPGPAGGYPQHGPQPSPSHTMSMPPQHMQQQHMGGHVQHMQPQQHPSHHPHPPPPPPSHPQQAGGGYMQQQAPPPRPPDMMNSAQTFSVNQPLGSALPPHHQPLLPSDPSKPMTAQQGLMHSIINDGSSAFRSHPLFPLLRDLIIADLNFHTPSFPFQLIANLPAEFDKLLMNYQNRNPPNRAYPGNPAVEGVIMDALRYAHQSLIEKIQVKKREVGYQETAKPLTAIEDFCERFDRAVKNTMPNEPGGGPAAGGGTMYGGPSRPSSSLPSTPNKHSSSKSNTDSSSTSTDSKPKTTATAGRNKVLPKEAVSTMLEWLKEHQDNPYPNDDEKEMLINKTKLTINQINYWFTNARRRILPKWALQRYMDQQKLQQQHHGPPAPPGAYRGMAAS